MRRGPTRDQVEAFRRDGFVAVSGLFSQEEIDRYAAAVDEAVARRTEQVQPLGARPRYEQSFLQCINLWEDFPAVRTLTFHPRVTESAAALLGAERVRLWHDQALYKEAGGRDTDPHQDLPYWPMAEDDALTAWIPFDDVARENGLVGFVPGSHRLGIRRFVNIFFGEPEDVLAHPAVAGREPVFEPVARGTVVFHHALTIHLAGPNRSASPRRVHTAIYFRDGATRAEKGVHPCVDRFGIGVGAPIASEATPIAWPRPEGDLPPAPSRPVPDDAIGRHLWPAA